MRRKSWFACLAVAVAYAVLCGLAGVPFDLPHLLLLPLGVVIATVAMSSGIAGASFWYPVYILMHIDHREALWLTLLTMFFGFGSGLCRNIRNRTIDYRMASRYLLFVIPGALVGSVVSAYLPIRWISTLFGAIIMVYGLRMLFGPARSTLGRKGIVPCLYGFVGGLLKGIISVGVEIIVPGELKCAETGHERIIGSMIVIVFVANLFIMASRVLVDPRLRQGLVADGPVLLNYMAFIAPAVMVGGQLGPELARKMSHRGVVLYVGVVLVLIGVVFLFLH